MVVYEASLLTVCACGFVSLFILAPDQKGHFIICKLPFIQWKSHLITP